MMELLLIFLLILVMVLVTILIITRSKAQRILLQLTRDQSTIQQATRIGSWEWDIPNNIIRFSQTGLEILGFDADTPSVPDAQFISRIYQPDRKTYINTLKKALKNQETFIGAFRCDMNKPFKRWFMSRGEVITDKNDIPVKVVGMHHDSTKTVIMRTLQMAINNIQQDIIRHEPLNTILSRICSTTQEIEPSIHCVIFLAKDDKMPLQLHHSQNIPQPLLQILNSITLVDENSELIQTLNNSDILYIEQLNELSCWKSANQIHNTLGLNAYYGQQIVNNQWDAKSVLCLYLQDNSIPVEIIHQMIESITGVISVAIEGQIQTDKKQKIQLQLYHSQKMESLGHLTSGIAHDFNNILGSIVGYNSLAKKLALKTGDKKLLSFISEVNTASERARDLISQMMIFSRSEPSKNRSVEVQPVIKEVLQLIKSMIPSSITINHQFEKELKKIQINPIALHQVILNLMVNAKDAISEQLGEITVRSYQSLQKRAKCLSCHKKFSGNYLCIEVTDTGSGIPSELMERIFDPFFTTKNIGRGTGMGLSVVHRILHDVNAHICGSSNPVKGTTLRLYFPPDSTPEDGLDNNNKLTTENSGPIGHGEHIMVVDDDIPLSLLYEEILTGYSEVLNEEKACEMGIKAILKKPVDMYQLLELIDETLHANV